jgi:serine/threonine-protein kinase
VSETGQIERKTVLVVEDDEAIRRFLSELLDRDGYKVVTAVDGVEGVQHTFAEAPDVVLTDLMMPQMDGLAYIRRVRSQVPAASLPIVVVSALATEDKIVEAFETGATDYLVKPFRPHELLARIRVALKQKIEPVHVDLSLGSGRPVITREALFNGALLDMGKYEIIAEIGEGGMGSVFLAKHRSFGTQVAVKILDPEITEDRRAVLRFLREVRIAAQLDHPNIVKVFDLGLTGNVYYYAMEKLPDHSLAEEVWDGGAMPEPMALDVGLQVASALEYMHGLGFIHRDVKPENILYAEEARVKLIDFGLARSMVDDRLTQEGSFVGTPGYVAPENITSFADPGPSADIYALGATLYAACVGKSAFEDKECTTAKLRAQLMDPPAPAHFRSPGVSREFSKIIGKMMSKNPEARYEDMKTVVAELKLLAGRG